MGETERGKIQNIAKIFKKSFNILEGFVTNNKLNQDLMWKYKNFFIMAELGASEQDGELELTHAIIQGNDNMATARSLKSFINQLNKRMGHPSNFVVLLDIFNKLMDYETSGTIRKSLVKLLLKQPEKLDSANAKNIAEYEASINVKEILFHILTNQELSYTKDSFILLFPLSNFVERLNSSLEKLDELEKNEENEDYDAQEYEELRESQQKVLIELYSHLHFNKNEVSIDISDVIDFFNNGIVPDYEEKLDRFLEEVDFDDRESYRLSEIKLVLLHYQILIKNIRECADAVYEKQLSRSGGSSSLMGSVGKSRNLIDTIQNKVGQVLDKLKRCSHDDIKDLLNNIMGSEGEEGEDKDISVRPSYTHNLNGSHTVNGSHTNISSKLNEIIHQASKKNKFGSNIKMKNRRTKESIGYGKAWARYVNEVSSSRYVRVLNNHEQNEVADFIFKILTKTVETEEDRLNLYSFTKFISNSIDFA